MDKELRREVISILVDNQANVLTRVSSLFDEEVLTSTLLQFQPQTIRSFPE